MAHLGVMRGCVDEQLMQTASGLLADRVDIMNEEGENLEEGPDIFADSNRELFEKIAVDAFSTQTQKMLVTECASSQGVSSPGFDTPPSSSADVREEASSPDEVGDLQAFPAVKDGSTNLFAYLGGPSVDLEDIEMDGALELDFAGQNREHDLAIVTPQTQTYPSLHQYQPSPASTHAQGDYRQETSPSDEIVSWLVLQRSLPHRPALHDQSQYGTGAVTSSVPSYQPVHPQSAISGMTPQPSFIYPQGPVQSIALSFDEVVAHENDRYDVSGENVLLDGTQPWASYGITEPQFGWTQYAGIPYPATSPPSVAPSTAIQGNFASVRPVNTQPLQRHPSMQNGSASPARSPASSDGNKNPGGRKAPLDSRQREQTNKMRKVGTCWICAFSRDKCDEGSPCGRCMSRSQRGHTHLLPCVRIHLQELVSSFLPSTMNQQHTKQDTISFVNARVYSWPNDAEIRVRLTSEGLGYFVWDLHEFQPSSCDSLIQKRYVLTPVGTWREVDKRSPPLAVKLVNWSQIDKLNSYVENIIERYLAKFQEECFAEEEVGATFQTDLLKVICRLYVSLPGKETGKNLKGDVRQVIKMLVTTYIMDHAITIVSEVQDSVISKMQNYNNPLLYDEWTSPMIANRQLKYFFSMLRDQQYKNALHRLQQILRTAQDKGKQWMAAFVLMLGIALVLEQCQHMIWLKAHRRVSTGESRSRDAEFEARRDCREIENRFDFLCKLYHCKYRGKHRQMTRFSEWSNKTFDPAEDQFVRDIQILVDGNGAYLLERSEVDVLVGMEQKNYTSRLVSRFLVELMGIDSSSP